MLARQILDAAERYCAGIGGDPRGERAADERWSAYLVQVGLAGQMAATRDLAEAVQVSFAMLSKAHSAGAEDQAGDAIEGGVSRLLAALNHRPDVPGPSDTLALADFDAEAAGPGGQHAPEPLSGALPLWLDIEPIEAQPDDASGERAAVEDRADAPVWAREGEGCPPPPLSPLPNRVEVDSQNFESGGLGMGQTPSTVGAEEA